jgi:cytochrome P450
MTKARLVFDPFSQEFYDDPVEIYREVREQSPVYYSEQYDFYALTRHEDVAAAFKDFETYSSAYGTDLSTVQSGEQMPQTLIIFMDPPNHRHMRSLLNKIFTPRAIQSQDTLVSDKIDKYLKAIEGDQFDVVQDLAAPFPVEVITTMLGVPDDHAQQIRIWIDESLRREPRRVDRPRRIRHRSRPHRSAEHRIGLRDSQLFGCGTRTDGDRDCNRQASRLHAEVRGGLGQRRPCHDAERRRLAPPAGADTALKIEAIRPAGEAIS